MKLFSLTLISVVCCFLRSCDGNEYKVIVETGDEEGAGTLGKVSIMLVGERGLSPYILLDNEGKSAFQRGQSDTFDITTDDVGHMKEIWVMLKSEKDSEQRNWLLKTVLLEDKERKITQSFPWNKWLKPGATQKRVIVEIPLHLGEGTK